MSPIGLDMYLTKGHYVQRWDHIDAEHQFEVTVTRGGKPYSKIKPERVTSVVEQLAYWRKANAIHAWFVRECQDGRDECQEAEVSSAKLGELRDICQRITNAHANDPASGVALAQELLPAQSGFFFGSTDYDEWYFGQVEETAVTLSALLAEVGPEGDWFTYQSSW